MDKTNSTATESVFERNELLLSTLKPTDLWQHFGELCATPRPSKEEEEIADYVLQLAVEKDYAVKRDALDNILISIPATPGYEHLPWRCLQSHLDMVCVKEKNIEKQFPIDLVLMPENILAANRTSLGADNGIGAAAMMAIMTDESVPHGPLELLFTTQEETGLVGAEAFPYYGDIQSKQILNLDSEEEAVLFVGCAGGARIEGIFSKRIAIAPSNLMECRVSLSGFTGGHSGLEIHHNRGNAIQLLAEVLLQFRKSGIFLVDINGGSANNAIPSEASATIKISITDIGNLKQALDSVCKRYPKEEGASFFISDKGTDISEHVFDEKLTDSILESITAIPTGVIRMDSDDTSLTETSNNIGIIKTTKDAVQIISMPRSSRVSALDELKKKIENIFTVAGATVQIDSAYAPWEPQFNTPFLKLIKEKAEWRFPGKVQVKTIHAGLECATFYKRIPDAQIVSIGPRMGKVHTTGEWVDIASVERFWKFLLEILTAA
jgi:dipeptidase D